MQTCFAKDCVALSLWEVKPHEGLISCYSLFITMFDQSVFSFVALNKSNVSITGCNIGRSQDVLADTSYFGEQAHQGQQCMWSVFGCARSWWVMLRSLTVKRGILVEFRLHPCILSWRSPYVFRGTFFRCEKVELCSEKACEPKV